MTNKIAFILTLAFVTGCTTVPQIKYETVEVKIPIPVECKTPTPEKPNFFFDKLTQESTIYDKVKAMLADRQLAASYETELLAALKSCK